MMAMMKLPTPVRRILVSLVLMLGMSPAWADGTVTHLSGPVSVQRPDGKPLPGAIGSRVLAGDTIATGAGGFARLEMTDGSEMVLRPDSQLQLESYTFAQSRPAEDNFVFSMLKGGLRTITGLVGKRGNRDAYKLRTATATIGIRGTQFDLRVCQASCGVLADGTYLAVRFGAVQASNAQGSLAVAAGQVAYAPPQRAPMILPRDPGIGFTPPPTIPKLDEKKKVQAATAAAASTPDKPKPAASRSGHSTQSTQDGSKPRSASSGSGSSDGSGKDAGGKASGQESSGSSTGTQQAVPGTQTASAAESNSSTSQSGAGPECSVQ